MVDRHSQPHRVGRDAVDRFVPFVGPYIAAAFPILLAALIDPGWSTVLITAVLFLVTEVTMGQVVEPLVFGHGTGISRFAVIVSTVFWTWLWGPLGLLLAMPMTVCLAVLGRNIEGLQFFEILLGDEPALTPQESFYQRLLAGDAAEATYETELCLNDQSLESCLNRVALSALKLADREARREVLGETQAAKIADTMKEILANLDDFEPRRWFFALRSKKSAIEEESQKAWLRSPKLLRTKRACPCSRATSWHRAGRRTSPFLDWRKIGARRGGFRHTCGGSEETRAGRQDTWARSNFRRPHCLACRHRCEVRLPVLSALGSYSCSCPLSREALAAHIAPRHRHPRLLLDG